MIDVHDEIVNFEIAEVGYERASRGAAALVDLSFLLEDVGLGPDLQCGVGQSKATGQPADSNEERGGVRVLGPFDRDGENLVVGQKLNGALRATLRVRDEDHRLAALAAAADFADPLGQAAAEFQRRLTRDVHRL